MTLSKKKGGDYFFDIEQERISNSFFSSTLAVNSLCTGTVLIYPQVD